MKKIDLKKELKHLYLPSAKRVSLVDVPELQFVMLDGRLEPGQTPETSTFFQDAISALYSISFTLKFMSKFRDEDPIDFAVMALEGLWWTDSGDFDFDRTEPWRCTLMMMQPDQISGAMYRAALQELSEKKPNPLLAGLRFESFREGLSIQIMHVGPYADEPRTLKKMQAFAGAGDYVFRGKHHEIYIGDPRRAKPENLRTVLRHPVEKIGSPAK